MNRQTSSDLAQLRAYRLRRSPRQSTDRPTRTEAAADRQATDHRARTYVLRGAGTPPTPEYRAARRALDALAAQRKEEG